MNEYPELDENIKINFFTGPQKRGSRLQTRDQCDHLGHITGNGYGNGKRRATQRLRCGKCGKRFGSGQTLYNLLDYQQKIKKIAYELFLYKYPLSGVARRWGIPQDKLSRFFKDLVTRAFEQNTEFIERELKSLPRGMMVADETFMGRRGSSNVEIVFINGIFEVLGTGVARPGDLKRSIVDVFTKIPDECKKKLRILVTDGEVSYESIARLTGGKVVHLVQFHAHAKRGQVTINKYVRVGPHHFHYKILTHWKAFAKGTHELRFRWEIKLVRGQVQAKKGRPSRLTSQDKALPKWRQKVRAFQSGATRASGSAAVFVNFKTNKLSMRRGASKWMVRLLDPLFKAFGGKHLTSSLVESKHHQVKSGPAGRKQQDVEYGHQLFTLSAFIADHGFLPLTNIPGRPLYRYLMKERDRESAGYATRREERTSIQTVLPFAA